MDNLLQKMVHRLHPPLTTQQCRNALLYLCFVQCLCRQYNIPQEQQLPFEALQFPTLFRRPTACNVGYEIREAAVILDEALPWDFFQERSTLYQELERCQQRLYDQEAGSPQWMQEQLDGLFALEDSDPCPVVTPSSLRNLVGALAAQRPAGRIVDICSGTGLLGLRVWTALGRRSEVACRGEESHHFLCALSRLIFFFCGVPEFEILEKDLLVPHDLQPHKSLALSNIYVADLPMVRSHTVKISNGDPRFPEGQAGVYTDWVFLREVLSRMGPTDRAFFIVTKGALVRQNERNLREHLVKNRMLEAVVALPTGLYPGSALPLALMVCAPGRDRVLFADLTDFAIPGPLRLRTLSQEGTDLLCGAFLGAPPQPGLTAWVAPEVISMQRFSLNPLPYLSPPLGKARIPLSGVAQVRRGVQSLDSLQKGAIPYRLVNIRDLRDGQICFERAEQLFLSPLPHTQDKYLLQEDDILLTSKGSTLKIVMVPPNPPAAYPSGNLTLLRVKPGKYSPYVLYEYLISPAGQQALNLIQTGTTIRVLSSRNLEDLLIPDYGAAVMEQAGQKLKQACLSYRQELDKLNRRYQDQRQELLEKLEESEA